MRARPAPCGGGEAHVDPGSAARRPEDLVQRPFTPTMNVLYKTGLIKPRTAKWVDGFNTGGCTATTPIFGRSSSRSSTTQHWGTSNPLWFSFEKASEHPRSAHPAPTSQQCSDPSSWHRCWALSGTLNARPRVVPEHPAQRPRAHSWSAVLDRWTRAQRPHLGVRTSRPAYNLRGRPLGEGSS